MNYLNTEEILRLHFQVINDFGGSHGVRNEDSLASVAVAPSQNVFGVEQYSDVFQKAAVYMRNIIGDHPFTDGNKRTGTVVCGIFLARNGYALAADPTALENFAVKVATERLSIEQIAKWLKQNTKSHSK